jgi:hypothetical protein
MISPYIHIAGIDLIKNNEGEFLVLEDNLKAHNVLSETDLTPAQVTQLAEDVEVFIKNYKVPEEKSVPIRPLTPNDNRPEPVNEVDEIEELEETINSLPKMRTMAVDMKNNQDKETTQSTSQEDLLKRKS